MKEFREKMGNNFSRIERESDRGYVIGKLRITYSKEKNFKKKKL